MSAPWPMIFNPANEKVYFQRARNNRARTWNNSRSFVLGSQMRNAFLRSKNKNLQDVMIANIALRTIPIYSGPAGNYDALHGSGVFQSGRQRCLTGGYGQELVNRYRGMPMRPGKDGIPYPGAFQNRVISRRPFARR